MKYKLYLAIWRLLAIVSCLGGASALWSLGASVLNWDDPVERLGFWPATLSSIAILFAGGFLVILGWFANLLPVYEKRSIDEIQVHGPRVLA